MPWYMQWWVWGLVGGIAVPWLIFGKSIRIGFEKSVQDGIGVWSGMCWFTVPLMLAIMYGFHAVTGK